MASTGRAIVSYGLETSKWALEDIEVRAPGEDELLVRMIASGICHTDVSDVGASYPCVLGHEGSGYVKAVGSKVTVAKPGDKVLCSYVSCGTCFYCKDGHPAHCSLFGQLNFAAQAPDYTVKGKPESVLNGSFFGQSSFASMAVVKQRSVVMVNDLIKDDEELKLFAPLGCGIQTGVGTISRVAKAQSGESVAIAGCGGVGLAGIMSAKIIGCNPIIAIDIVESRIELAKALGATHGINSKALKPGQTLADAMREITDGVGPNVSMDTTAVMPVIDQLIEGTRNMGRIVTIGAAAPDKTLSIHAVGLVLSGKKIMGGVEGDSVPEKSVREMIGWYREGRFPLDKLVKYYNADDFQAALGHMKTGETIKPVLLF